MVLTSIVGVASQSSWWQEFKNHGIEIDSSPFQGAFHMNFKWVWPDGHKTRDFHIYGNSPKMVAVSSPLTFVVTLIEKMGGIVVELTMGTNCSISDKVSFSSTVSGIPGLSIVTAGWDRRERDFCWQSNKMRHTCDSKIIGHQQIRHIYQGICGTYEDPLHCTAAEWISELHRNNLGNQFDVLHAMSQSDWFIATQNQLGLAQTHLHPKVSVTIGVVPVLTNWTPHSIDYILYIVAICIVNSFIKDIPVPKALAGCYESWSGITHQ